MKCYRQINNKGFTILEMCISILVICLCIPLLTNMISIGHRQLQFQHALQDEIAIIQLRRYLAIAYDLEVNDNQITFTRADEDMRLHVVNRNLIIQPGTYIFLDDIDHVYFYTRVNTVMMEYQRGDQEYEVFLYQK
ncbi:MAG: type II secretion system GspH family protein [Erysipelotrichaceae bacterium]|nr:type II secretion system GspH family protein [Erysipelotrichaceae bacterium]